jgi:peptidoglycan hydrolase CwlO-like protein
MDKHDEIKNLFEKNHDLQNEVEDLESEIDELQEELNEAKGISTSLSPVFRAQ